MAKIKGWTKKDSCNWLNDDGRTVLTLWGTGGDDWSGGVTMNGVLNDTNNSRRITPHGTKNDTMKLLSKYMREHPYGETMMFKPMMLHCKSCGGWYDEKEAKNHRCI